MNEAQAIAHIETQCSEAGLKAFEVTRFQSDPIDGNRVAYMARFAVIVKDGSITPAVISKMMFSFINTMTDMEYGGTQKHIDDLKTEILFIDAKISIKDI